MIWINCIRCSKVLFRLYICNLHHHPFYRIFPTVQRLLLTILCHFRLFFFSLKSNSAFISHIFRSPSVNNHQFIKCYIIRRYGDKLLNYIYFHMIDSPQGHFCFSMKYFYISLPSIFGHIHFERHVISTEKKRKKKLVCCIITLVTSLL